MKQAEPKMQQSIHEIYKHVATTVTQENEHAAALRLLALVALSDAELVPIERRTTEEIAADWREDLEGLESLNHLVEPAIAAAAAALQADEAEAFIDDIDTTITSRVLRSALYSAAREVAQADRKVTSEEGSVLEQIAVRFA